MGAILSLSAELETITCWAREPCGIQFAVPREFMRQASVHGFDFYCPRGHCLSIGKSDLDKVKEELEQERQRRQWSEKARNQAQHAAAIARGKLKAQSERVKNGVCPCCKRHFTNLERHMHTKHPEFDGERELVG